MNSKQSGIAAIALIATLSACATPGQEHAANVYSAEQVNQVQNAKTVQITVIMPAKIKVSNEQNKKQAQIGGALLGAVLGGVIADKTDNKALAGGVVGGVAGAAAGTMVPDEVLVDGVTLAYIENGQTLTSTQVGRLCEFKIGTSVLVSTSENVTRIQPNSTCPEDKKS